LVQVFVVTPSGACSGKALGAAWPSAMAAPALIPGAVYPIMEPGAGGGIGADAGAGAAGVALTVADLRQLPIAGSEGESIQDFITAARLGASAASLVTSGSAAATGAVAAGSLASTGLGLVPVAAGALFCSIVHKRTFTVLLHNTTDDDAVYTNKIEASGMVIFPDVIGPGRAGVIVFQGAPGPFSCAISFVQGETQWSIVGTNPYLGCNKFGVRHDDRDTEDALQSAYDGVDSWEADTEHLWFKAEKIKYGEPAKAIVTLSRPSRNTRPRVERAPLADA